ncbi:MAG: amino acid dehydrogenase [Cyclobacteriaceae bacterium]|nr:amino acid dehydrogenase [Cyclobacteriaceae bacterium]MCH8514731.1 amino acid dehydrogenase [Cyclobacteriaceae bacterium]
MKDLLKKFEDKKPEIVFEWSDSETEAEGWVVINSLRGGAAGGGTRMRLGLDRNEVESLAKTMEIKFTVSGPNIGGAKSGINFDPADPRKAGVLDRWYKAVIPLLKSYYGTGGDLNIDEIHEVIPITERYGLWHPQEGVVTGHFQDGESAKIKKIGQLRQGVAKVLEDLHFTPSVDRKYTVADMITGYGVAESVKHYYHLWGGDVSSKRAVIQGWGNVGAAAAYYLSRMGVKIVGIIDRAGGIIKEEGLSNAEVHQLFLDKNGNALYADQMLSFQEVDRDIWDVKADIFVPAAASRLINRDHVDRLLASGVEVVACGANVAFADKEIFYGPIAEYADNRMAIIADFIANCGMARVFAYLMEEEVEVTDEAIFKDTSRVIGEALGKIKAIQPENKKLSAAAFQLSLEQLV